MSKDIDILMNELDAIRMVNAAFTAWEYAWDAALAGFVTDADDVQCLMRIGDTDSGDFPSIDDLQRMYTITDRLGTHVKAAADLNMLNLYASQQKILSMTIQ